MVNQLALRLKKGLLKKLKVKESKLIFTKSLNANYAGSASNMVSLANDEKAGEAPDAAVPPDQAAKQAAPAKVQADQAVTSAQAQVKVAQAPSAKGCPAQTIRATVPIPVPPAKFVQFKRCLAPLLLSVLLLSGCGGEKQDQAGEQQDAVPVQVVAVEKGSLASTALVTGKLEAAASANVVPGGAGGKVESVKVQVGDRVQKGQTLVVLENTALAAVVRQAEQGVAQAESSLKLAQVDYEQAKANYERGKTLYEQGAISQSGPSGFETAFEIPYKKAKEAFEKIMPSALESAKAGLVQARENYNNAFVKSPISGVVTACNVNPGELASPGSPIPVVTVVSLDKVEVEATVTEDQINRLQEGQKVPVLVGAVSAEPFTGVITNIALAADQVSKAFPIKVQLDNQKHILKPGMFAEVQLMDRKTQVLLVPREAVIAVSGRDVVWAVADNKAASRPVTTGVSDGKQIEISSGLGEGEQVVVLGQDSLQENALVEIVE